MRSTFWFSVDSTLSIWDTAFALDLKSIVFSLIFSFLKKKKKIRLGVLSLFYYSMYPCWILKFLIDLEQFPPLLFAGSYDQHFTEQLNYPWLHCRHLLQLENLNCDPQGKFFKHYHHFSPKVSSLVYSPASTLLHKLLGSELKMSFLSPLAFRLDNFLAWLVSMKKKNA